MTELVAAVRLKYDGTGVTGQIGETKAAIDGLAASAKAVGPASAEIAKVGASAEAAAGEVRSAADAMRQLTATTTQSATATQALGAVLKSGAGAHHAFAVSAGQSRASMQDLGYQISDFGTEVLSGISPLRAFTQQSGQVAFAMSGMEGAAGSVGRFLAGPWGAAILIGVSALGEFLPALFDASSALDRQEKATQAAVTAADSFGAAQTSLGKIFDLTTGKLKTQNEVLIQSVKLQATLGVIKAKADIKSGTKALAAQGEPGYFDQFLTGAGAAAAGLGSDAVAGATAQSALQAQAAKFAPLKATLDAFSAVANDPRATPQAVGAALDTALAKVDALGKAGRAAGKNIQDVSIALITLGTAAIDRTANQQQLDVIAGGAIPADLKPYERPKKTRVRKTPDSSGLVNSVENDIRGFNAEFTDTPTFVEKARVAIAKLDQDIAQLAKKKPPSFQSLIDQAQAAKGVIEANIDKPYADFLRQQDQAFQVSKLLAGGHTDEAAALRQVFALQQQMGPLTDIQKDGVLATVQALRAEAEQQQRLTAARQQDLDALDRIRSSVEGIFTGGAKLGDLPKQLAQAFRQLEGQQLFDKLLGPSFKSLTDQVNGVSPVKNAAAKMAEALDSATQPVRDLGGAARDAIAGLKSAAAGGGTGSAASYDMGNLTPSLSASLKGSVEDVFAANPDLFPGQNDITVTGRRQQQATDQFMSAVELFGKSGKDIGGSIDRLVDPNGRFFGKIGAQLGNVLQGYTLGSAGGSIGSAVGSLAGLFGKSADGSSLLGDTGIGGDITSLSSAVGSALPEYAAAQAIDSVIGKGLQSIGVKYSKTGQELFGTLGGVVFGALKKSKKGGATISDETSAATSFGNDGARKATAASLAGSIQSQIAAIADELGGTAGSFGAITIGQYKDKYRVNTQGTKLGGSSAPVAGLTSYDTPEAAQAAALSDAIAEGAIGGISAQMKKALSSSTDVSKSVAEALQVRGVEDILTGLGADLLSSFRSFETQAQARVKIAQEYGFDVTKIEQYNADQRKALIDSTAKQQTGSLSDLLASLVTGDLSEGDAASKRQALLGKIGSAETDAKAGKDGAGDTLSGLLQQLVQTSKDAFGTAGPEYAADRATAQSAAEAVIAAEKDRIAAADAAVSTTNASLATANTLANENNAQNAQMLAKLDALVGAAGARAVGTATLDTRLVARTFAP